MSKFVAFLKNDSGATAIEYGLIAAGISVAIIAVVNALGSTAQRQVHQHLDPAEITAWFLPIRTKPPATAAFFANSRQLFTRQSPALTKINENSRPNL